MDPKFTNAEYILRALAVGLPVDEDVKRHDKDTGTRRQSLTQRLGLNSPPTKDKGKDTDMAGSGNSGGDDDDDGDRSAVKKASKKQPKLAKAECVEVVGNSIFVGTNDGHVLHYTASPVTVETEEPPERCFVSGIDLKLGTKRIEQLIALPGQDKLVILCASTLSFYSLSELRPVASGMQPIRGVSCVALDERVPRSADAEYAGLCVACLRTVQIYRLSQAELRLEQEFAVTSSIGSISHYGNYVCLADTETYKIIDLQKMRRGAADDAQLPLLPTQQPQKDPQSGKIIRPPRPNTLVVGPNEFMFLTASGAEADGDTLGVIVTALGEAKRGTLQFTSYPKSIIYDDPFVVALFASGSVEIHDTRQPDKTLVKTFSFADSADSSQPRRLCTTALAHVSTESPVPEVIDTTVLGIAGLNELMTDHARREVVPASLPASPSGKLLSRLSRSVIVAVGSDSLYYVAREPPIIHVTHLIADQRIEEAMIAVDAAQQPAGSSRITNSPQTLEAQYCIQLAAMTCLKNMLFDDALQYFRRGLIDPRALLYLFPDIVEYLGPLLVPFARIPLASGLRSIFCDIGDVDALLKSGSKQLLSDNSGEEQAAILVNALMANLLEVLERYLEFCRGLARSGDLSDVPFAPDAVPVIDTALVRIYTVNSRHDKLCAVLQDPSSAVVSDLAADYFLKSEHYYYHSLMLKARGDIRGVLDTWHRLLLGEWTDERFGGMEEYLQLVQLTDSQSTVLAEFSWLVGVDVGASLRLLSHLSDDSVASIDADSVFAAIERQGDRPMRVFIERLLSANHPQATRYMTYLVNAYVRQLRDYYLVDSSEARERRSVLEDGFKCAQAENLRLRFRSYLGTLSRASEGAALRVQVLAILTARQKCYDPGDILECIEQEAAEFMYIEQAALLVIMNRTDDAVDLLVNKAGDYAEAELLLLNPDAPSSLAQLGPRPAAHQSPAVKPTDTSAILRLLRTYLSFKDDDLSARLVSDLLERYSEILELDILAEIPDQWALSVVESFVCRGLQRLTAESHSSDVRRSLHQSRTFASDVEYVSNICKHGPIALDYSQICSKCNKLLGSSAFVYEPSTSTIKHVSCA
ncbi:hypothetical protein GGI15_001616 [Coemansia interrupta]|uniref:CNH domain-containing protein n=1 Tax=Coemansia interrupta TaxID=1126814 RepID=A0A9W8HHM3_9FUNG|nr:hypothetical protein GGI15_001616 [Coemansia interrupta]